MFEKGKIIGSHYQVLECLGEGGMGMVYKALDDNLHREVALKFIHREYLEDKASMERFKAEGRILASLRHANVVDVYALETDETTGLPFLVMEYIKGKHLDDFLKDAGKPVGLVLGLFLQILDGIEACHKKGVVHRDLKPKNILVDDLGVARLVDFGIARTSQKMTRTGMPIGTAGYMSPEQCMGKSELSGMSDIYSLGILLWEQLLGELPFTADEASDPLLALALMHLNDPVPIERVQKNPVAAPFAPLLAKMLAKAPEARPEISEIRVFLTTEGQRLGTVIPTSPSPEKDPKNGRDAASGVSSVSSATEGGSPGENGKGSAKSLAGGTEVPLFVRIIFLGPIILTVFLAGLFVFLFGGIQRDLQVVGPGLSSPPEFPEDMTNTIGMKLRLIPSGEFLMGSPSAEESRDGIELLHRVSISRPFYLGAHEVTQGEWQTVMGTTLSRQKDMASREKGHFGAGENFPMYYVSWEEARNFCGKLSEREGKVYRLPTEAEWEYACRAGSPGPFSGDPASAAWLGINSGGASPEKLATLEKLQDWNSYYGLVRESKGATHPVGLKKANAWGLYDMQGNVWEWCYDWFDPYFYGVSPPGDPYGPGGGMFRCVRGGGWADPIRSCRSAFRGYIAPDLRSEFLGFRVLREL